MVIHSPSRAAGNNLNNVELERRVASHLAGARSELADIVVAAQGDEVRLTGCLPSFYLRQLAISCARRVAGVRQVIDQLCVDELRRARSAAAPCR